MAGVTGVYCKEVYSAREGPFIYLRNESKSRLENTRIIPIQKKKKKNYEEPCTARG